MKYLATLVNVSALFIGGCTSPTQKVAIEAMRRGLTTTDQIHEKLADMAWQNALNGSWTELEAAIDSDDKAAAAAALEKFSDIASDVRFLDIQYERARAMLRVPLQYIYEQQGIVDLWWEDIKKSKARSDAKDE